jgi:hypothetical protein
VKASTILSWLFIAAAAAVYLAPPPDGVSVETMHAAALVVFTVGLWAAGALPEHIVGLLSVQAGRACLHSFVMRFGRARCSCVVTGTSG